MTKEEMVKRLEKACEADDLFPGVLGNPVTFAARWGLSLSKTYLKDGAASSANGIKRRRAIPAHRAAKSAASHATRGAYVEAAAISAPQTTESEARASTETSARRRLCRSG